MESGFVWHKVSDKEKEEIKKQAKELLEDFSRKIEKIDVKEEFFEKGEGLRDEGDGWNTNDEFRNIMFANAPFVDDEFLVAEKGGWKK
ncbi:MAG: hypothetical protein Q7S33_02500 [Nanoarchaeota archaeon]|nr:hypothetical protein [Nanoarchaeota archaeon]